MALRPPARQGISWKKVRLTGVVPDTGQYLAAQAGDSPYLPLSVLPAGTPLERPVYAWVWPGVPDEPVLPVQHSVLYENEDFLIAWKPHFLPTTTNGKIVVNTLQTRLRVSLNNSDIVPLHRLDVMTAGLVLCSVNPATRSQYQQLFATSQIQKTYRATVSQPWTGPSGIVQLGMVKAKGQPQVRVDPQGRMTTTKVTVLNPTLVELQPITGHTHQLRVLCAHFGSPILGDDVYPVVHNRNFYDLSTPLALEACTLEFDDPRTNCHFHFTTL